MKILYFDIFSGISGDMTVAALLDLGLDFEEFKSEIKSLNLKDYEISLKEKNISGIMSCDFDVKLTKKQHIHRNLNDIKTLIEKSNISENAKKITLKIFVRLALSEAKVHGTSIEEIHFHEVGAIDSIIDIVGCAICIDKLNIDAIFFGDLPSFYGEIECTHGIIPLPAPAVADLTLGLQFSGESEKGELVTPTGASILTALGNQIKSLPSGTKTLKIGYGCGKKKFTRPNYLRVILGEIDILEEKYTEKLISDDFPKISHQINNNNHLYENNHKHDHNHSHEHEHEDFSNNKKNTLKSCENLEIVEIEFNIDDMNPELYENLMEQLFSAGALDVFMTNIIMKKSRPAIMFTVIAPYELKDKIAEIIFKNSTTIGIRYEKKDRICLEREIVETDTVYGKIRVKNTIFNGKIINSKPEYEDCKAIAESKNITLKEVYNKIKI